MKKNVTVSFYERTDGHTGKTVSGAEECKTKKCRYVHVHIHVNVSDLFKT